MNSLAYSSSTDVLNATGNHVPYVTCHTAELTFLPQPYPKVVLDLSTP